MKRHLEGLYKSFPPSSPQHINILCLFSHREPSVDIHKYSNNENYRFLFTKSFLHVKSIIRVDKVDTLSLFANPGNIFSLLITGLTPTPTPAPGWKHREGWHNTTCSPQLWTWQTCRRCLTKFEIMDSAVQYSILRETSHLHLKLAQRPQGDKRPSHLDGLFAFEKV